MVEQLTTILQQSLAAFPTVKLGYLFGSQATGRTGPLSDVDVAVYLDEPDVSRRFETRLELIGTLTSALKRNDVDVVVLNDVGRPSLKYAVIADGQRIYEVEPFRLLVEPRIVREHFDFRQSLRRHRLLKV